MHCIAMCGPLILALPIGKYSIRVQYIYTFIYHSGRLLTYMLLGTVLGLFGNRMWTSGVFNYFSVFLGVVMLCWSILNLLNFSFSFYDKLSYTISRNISITLNKKRNFATFFILGSLNGLLPCGLVYTALSSTFLYHTTSEVILLMVGFGLATIPLLVALKFMMIIVPDFMKKKWNQFQKFIMIFIAVILIVRGLEIKIPFLTPNTKPEMIECH